MLPSRESSTLAALLRGLHTMPTSVDDLLRRAVENKSSDLHLKVGNHPYLRVDGLLTPLTEVPRVTPEAKVQGNGGIGYGLRRGGPRTFPRERFPATRERRHGPARHSLKNPHLRR